MNCPECLGAGGNYVEVPVQEIDQFEIIVPKEIALIQRRIELIESLNHYTEKTELVVNQAYLTLINTIYSDHIHGLIKRLEAIRSKFHKSHLIAELETKIQNIEQLNIKFNNSQPTSIGPRISFESGYMMVILMINNSFSLVIKKELLIKYLEVLYSKATIRGPYNSMDITGYGLDSEVRKVNATKYILFKYNLNNLTKYFVLDKEYWAHLSIDFCNDWRATNDRGVAIRNHR